MKDFNVLSLFDGMSCSMIALQKLGIKPKKYFASEIDKYAIQVSKANWPEIIHIGDVTKVHYFEGVLYTEFGSYEIDFNDGLLCGGSPCQGFSFAGKQLNFEDPRSKLFFEFVRIWKEIKAECPSVKVFLENVVMKKEYQAVISRELGIEPILINSALVSAQNRKRLYWTDIPFQGQPADRGILLKHILEDTPDAVCVTERRTEEAKQIRRESMKNGRDFSPRRAKELVERTDGKANCLTATQTVEHLLQTGVVLNRGEYQERNEKAMCLDANYWKGVDNHGQRTMIKFTENYVQFGQSSGGHNSQYYRASYPDGKQPCISSGRAEPKVFLGERPEVTLLDSHSSKDGLICVAGVNKNKMWLDDGKILQRNFSQGERIYSIEGKSTTLSSQTGGTTGVGNCLVTNNFTYRKLTVTECERLQTVPDGYTSCVSNTQAYKMLGNGWNVDTIVHLFEPLLWLDVI